MRKFSFFLLFFTLVSLSCKAFDLSPNATISLLTCSPGDDFYESYGHSALRVKDPINDFDLVYNYGTFSFSDDFILNFIKGKLTYWVNPENYLRFRRQYDFEKRSIYEQILDFSPSQKQSIYDYLAENSKKENRYYQYEFRYNNCSSKLRDVIEASTGIQFSNTEKTNESFRDMIDSYVNKAKWYDFGTDLLLGATLDKKVTISESMFLPDYLMNVMEETKVNGKPLVKEKRTVLDNGYNFYTEGKNANIFSPSLVFWLLLLVFFLFKIYYKGKLPHVFSFLYLTILGLAGWFMVYLWFFTLHTSTLWNLNVLWAIPFHFPMAFFVFMKYKPKWVAHYFFFCRVILIAFLIIWPLFLPQEFNIAILPLILISLLCISSNVPVSMEIFNKKQG